MYCESILLNFRCLILGILTEGKLVFNFLHQVLTLGALHQIDSAALRSAAAAWHDEFAPLPKPLLVVNIGWPTSNFLSCFLRLMFYIAHRNSLLITDVMSDCHYSWSLLFYLMDMDNGFV